MIISWEFFNTINYEIFKEITDYSFKFLLKPDFISITICNNNKNYNIKLIKFFIKKNIKVAPHIIFTNTEIKKFFKIINNYFINNINKIVVLKGDELNSNIFFSYNLINFIKKNFRNYFIIYSAIYTELHQNSFNLFSDIKNSLIKKQIGTKYFITQYFYNLEIYYFYFKNINKIKKNTIILIPGIMILNSLEQLINFSNLCKSDIYLYVKKFNKIKNNFFINFNINFIINLIIKLVKIKIFKFHFYTMNKIYFIEKILEKLINNFNI